MSDLAGRIAVVSGASAGIGEAVARELVARGAQVVINARRAERLAALAHELGRHRVVEAPGDAADPACVARMLDTAREAYKRDADLVVVNAGRGLDGSVLTSDPGQWEEMVRTNLLGAARLMRAAAERMLAHIEAMKSAGEAWTTHAHDIVVIGSNVGRHISPFSSMYGSTKFAVNSLAEALRRELAPRGVRVPLVEPGFVVSEFQGVAGYDDAWFAQRREALGPLLEPADIARTIAFIVGQPAHVHVSDTLIRPTRQDYP